MSKPPNLVDLPQDVLDHFCEHLLPSLDHPSPLDTDRISIPIPVDLHQMMLVCKRLHDLALPWAWRRLAIHMGPYKLEDSLDFKRLGDPRLHHPTRFAHVRVFALSFERVDVGPNDPVPVLTTLKSCISLMKNLQVLMFDCFRTNPAFIDDICTSLISRPRLHTLITPMEAPAVQFSSTSLKRLRVTSRGEWFRIAPFLESLSIPAPWRDEDLTSPIPWSTLREVHVFGVRAVDGIIKDFSTWKRTFPDTCSPLNEIIFEFDYRPPSDQLSDCLDRIFRVFRTPDIHTLSLVSLEGVDGEFLDRIADAFPGVKSLSLTTQSGFIWSLPSVDVALGRFPKLRELRWDFKDAALFGKGFGTDLDDPDIGPQRFIPSIAARCKVLEYVTFLNSSIRHRTYSIHRDGKGRYARCHLVGEEYFVFFSTSSWNPTSYPRI